jgi:hypothetical protein
LDIHAQILLFINTHCELRNLSKPGGSGPTVENLSPSVHSNIGMLEYFFVLNCQQPWFDMQLNHPCMTKACSTDASKMTFSSHYHTSKKKYLLKIKMERGTVELILIMYWHIKHCQLYLATKLHMLHCKKLK